MSYLNQCPDCGSDIRFQASGILKGAFIIWQSIKLEIRCGL